MDKKINLIGGRVEVFEHKDEQYPKYYSIKKDNTRILLTHQEYNELTNQDKLSRRAKQIADLKYRLGFTEKYSDKQTKQIKDLEHRLEEAENKMESLRNAFLGDFTQEEKNTKISKLLSVYY